MSNTVIKVENVSKLYNLKDVGVATIKSDIKRAWANLRGKEDPAFKLAEANDRASKGISDFVWALKDINFEVQQGEVLGILGKNGAGKSTLLKILSRVAAPTTGQIKMKGRLASLLEVGTGFHPDLSGRENIFLNGSILGMTKSEIKKNFDEIVDFSGIERYIDTPVKRYSSGMYVRLAFAVSAYLESEILIVDEVLAVGDAEFQKKCLGKMKDVSGQGRTVLFVSHNMPSIRALCDKCLYLEKGIVKSIGEANKIIGEYLTGETDFASQEDGIIPANLSLYNTGEAKFKKAFLLNEQQEKVKQLNFMEKFKVELELDIIKEVIDGSLSLFIVNQYGDRILMAAENATYKPSTFKAGTYSLKIEFNEELMPGNYYLGMALSYFHTGSDIDNVESFYPFTVIKESKDKKMEYPWATVHGYTKPHTKWTINQLNN